MREVEVELAAFHQGYATPMPVEGSRKVRRLRGTPCPLWVDTRLSLRSKADARRNVRCRGAPPSQCGQERTVEYLLLSGQSIRIVITYVDQRAWRMGNLSL